MTFTGIVLWGYIGLSLVSLLICYAACAAAKRADRKIEGMHPDGQAGLDYAHDSTHVIDLSPEYAPIVARAHDR